MNYNNNNTIEMAVWAQWLTRWVALTAILRLNSSSDILSLKLYIYKRSTLLHDTN